MFDSVRVYVDDVFKNPRLPFGLGKRNVTKAIAISDCISHACVGIRFRLRPCKLNWYLVMESVYSSILVPSGTRLFFRAVLNEGRNAGNVFVITVRAYLLLSVE